MDSDYQTAFGQTFVDQAIELRPGVSPNDGSTLFVSFSPSLVDFSIGVMDYHKGGYSHRLDSGDPEAVRPFFAAVEADYGVAIDPKIVDSVELYLRVLPEVAGVYTQLADDFTTCGGCGDPNDDSLEGFYGPPLTPGGPASLAVYSRSGCSSTESVYGDPKDVGKKAIAIIESAIEFADDKDAVEAAQTFLDRIREITSE